MRNVIVVFAVLLACSGGRGGDAKKAERAARRAYVEAVTAARDKVMSCEEFMTRGDTSGWQKCSADAVMNQLRAQTAYQKACEACAPPDKCQREVRRVKQSGADAADETACP